jgi:hypothetical protein
MSSIQLETLKKEYENLLQMYQESIQNYITVISGIDKNNLVTIEGRTWWGTIGIEETQSENIEQCKAICSNNINCSGATFNPSKKYCWIRGGDNVITPGLYNDFAIITKEKEAFLNMKGLNDQLIKLNQQIMYQISLLDSDSNKESNSKIIRKNLLDSYNNLLQEKIKLDLLIKKYLDTDKILTNQEIYSDQQNSLVKIWTIITLITVLLVIKELLGVKSLPIEISFWFLIIILLLLLSFMIKTANGFFILSLIVIGIIFTR